MDTERGGLEYLGEGGLGMMQRTRNMFSFTEAMEESELRNDVQTELRHQTCVSSSKTVFGSE